MTIRVVVDGRCLQDLDYATRGVGQHVRALLRYRRRQSLGDLHLTALLDRALPPLTAEDRALFEEKRTTAYVPAGERCVFLSTSPMTHSPLPMARLLMRPDVRRVALAYDFIPYDRPEQYLSSEVARTLLRDLPRLAAPFRPLLSDLAVHVAPPAGVAKDRAAALHGDRRFGARDARSRERCDRRSGRRVHPRGRRRRSAQESGGGDHRARRERAARRRRHPAADRRRLS